MGFTSIASLFSTGISSIPDSEINTNGIYCSFRCAFLPSDLDSSRSSYRPSCRSSTTVISLLFICCVWCVLGHWRQWWVEQELLEVADQGVHCLAWQSRIKGEICKDSSAKVVDSHDGEGVSKNMKMNGNSGEKYSELVKVEDSCDEETDIFLDAEVEQDQAKLDQKLATPEEDEDTHKVFKLNQPLDTDEDEKFFIVQPLDDKETEQDQVIALMKKQDLASSDYEDMTDAFRDIEIEDLEAEKENVGGNVSDVEKFRRENSSLVSRIHWRADHKKLQETSKESCVETYEEIII